MQKLKTWFITMYLVGVTGIASSSGIPAGMEILGYDSETVMPTVLLTDTGGTIVYSHQTDNYRVRPEPGTFLEVMTGLQSGG